MASASSFWERPQENSAAMVVLMVVLMLMLTLLATAIMALTMRVEVVEVEEVRMMVVTVVALAGQRLTSSVSFGTGRVLICCQTR